MTIGAALAGTGALSSLMGTASAQNAMYMRDAYVGPDNQKSGLGTKGWLYFATDSGTVYHHDGSGWTPFVSSPWSDSDSDNLLELSNSDGIDVSNVKTNELTVSGETLLRSYQSSDVSVSAGSWSVIQLDTTEKDELNELDTTNFTFTPSETGWYFVSYSVGFSVGNDGDRLRVQLYDTTAGEFKMFRQQAASGASYQHVKETNIVKLTGGNTYELQAKNKNSSDTLRAGSATTYLTVRKANR